LAAKVGLQINKLKTILKYMITVGNMTIVDAEQNVAFADKNFEVVNEKRISVLGSSCDTEERRGFGDTAKNPNCK
jgi:hypothetical protein